MRPLRVVVADDEPMARQRLRRLLGARGDCELVGEYADGTALVAGLITLSTDCILLDIDMPGIDGFASLAALPAPHPLVVFVTAFSEFAARAYEVDAVDYLLKPVSAERLDAALVRVARRRAQEGNAALAQNVPSVRFVVQGRIYLLDPTTISTIQSMGNYVEITMADRVLQLRTTLSETHSRLDPATFARVHRSWIVARPAVAQVTSLPSLRFDILLRDGRHIPGGRNYGQSLRVS